MTRRLGDYELRAMIGVGASGAVWDAWDEQLHRRTAVKVVRLAGMSEAQRDDIHARFRQEAAITANLKHPGLLDVYRYGETSDEAFLAMEFIDGETLRALLVRGERLPPEHAVALVAEVLRTLEHCHRAGIVHRDIKPGNLMLPRGGGVKLADFGIARREASELTAAGLMIGTPHYMSPEQFTADAPADARTDVWSCGVVLYELLTGQRPFRGDLAGVMQQVLNVTPPPPSALLASLPWALDAVVARALARRREDRFPSAQAFADALLAAMAPADDRTVLVPLPSPIPMALPSAPPLAPRTIGRGFLAFLAAIAMIAAGLGANAWWGRAVPPAPPAPRTEHRAEPSRPEPIPAPAPMPGSLPAGASKATDIAVGLAGIDCTLLHLTEPPGRGTPSVRGLVGEGIARQALAALLDRHGGVAVMLDVQVFPATPTYCRLADLARRYRIAGQAALNLDPVSGQAVLRTGDPIRLRLVMPDYDASIHVAYFDTDGGVEVLGAARNVPATAPAGAALGGVDGVELFIGPAGAPYGTDLVLAIASTRPLPGAPPPGAMPATAYLERMVEVLRNARAVGIGMSAQVTPVRTMAR